MNVDLDFFDKDPFWHAAFYGKHVFCQNARLERYAFSVRVGDETLFAIYSGGRYIELCILSGEAAEMKLKSKITWPKED